MTKRVILNLYKKEGETPLQRLERFKVENPEYKDEKMTYAGRLDPMAEGVLLVLTGEDIHKKDELLHLDKEYEFEVVWGIYSDTYDILGEVIFSKGEPSDGQIAEDVPRFKGSVEIPYPAYSSKTIGGKPMWSLARTGELSELEYPKRSMNIIELQFLGSKTVGGDYLLNEIQKRIDKIEGDFRQEAIISLWQDNLNQNKNSEYKISKFRATVSSGTYIRSLAVRLGEKYSTGALAWSIKRTKVGDYKIEDSIK